MSHHKRFSTKQIACLSLILLLAITLTACNQTKRPPDKLVLQLPWYHDTEFTGFYVAAEHDYYRDAGIALKIKEGGVDIPAAAALENGDADIALIGFEQFQALRQSPQIEPVAVAAIYQISPRVIITLADSGLTQPEDLAGKRIAIKNEVWQRSVRTVLENNGLSLADVIEVPVHTNDLEGLYQQAYDATTGFAHDEPIAAQLSGHPVNLIFTNDYGDLNYDGLIVTSRTFLDENPDLVKSFMAATTQGWQLVITNPTEGAEILADWCPDEPSDFYLQSLESLIPLVIPATQNSETSFGWIDAQTWQLMMGADYNPNDPGFTTDFLVQQ